MVVSDIPQLIQNVSGWVRKKSHEMNSANTEITPETDLLGSGVLDSLGFIELVAFIEETTGRQVDLLDIDPEQFTTVRGLCEFALRNGAAA